MSYADFLARKADHGTREGFAPSFVPGFLFDFQGALVEWGVLQGRGAIFADCGMGKTPMQLVWAENVVRHANRPVLVLTPLAVAGQTVEEAEKFGIEASRGEGGNIVVANYERLQLDVIERAVTLWTNPGETVLTPFMGVGSEVYGAVSLGRFGLGIELKPSYFRQAEKNLAEVNVRKPEQTSVFAEASS